IVISPSDTEPWHIADFHLRDVLDLHGNAVDLGQDHILYVRGPIPLGQILIAAAVDQANAADIDRLLANGDFAAADVDIGIAQRADQLRHCDAVGLELLQIRYDV